MTTGKRNVAVEAVYKDPQWKRMRAYVLLRDKYKCWVCGQLANQVDHVMPLSKGGANREYNLAAICIRCNSGKRDRWDDEPIWTVNWDTE